MTQTNVEIERKAFLTAKEQAKTITAAEVKELAALFASPAQQPVIAVPVPPVVAEEVELEVELEVKPPLTKKEKADHKAELIARKDVLEAVEAAHEADSTKPELSFAEAVELAKVKTELLDL